MQTLEEKQQDGMTGAGPETEFHTELFGFNRVEVLSYIERISAANAEKARALEDTIAALQKDLTGVRRQGSTLAQKAKQVFNELENQKKRAEDAVAEAAAAACPVPVSILGAETFAESGDLDQLMEKYGYSARNIAARAREVMFQRQMTK